MPEQTSASLPPLTKSNKKIPLLIIGLVLVIGLIGSAFWVFVVSKGPSAKVDLDSKQTTTAETAETWTRTNGQIFPNTTSTSTIKVSDNLFRMFVGGVSYRESSDGVTWGSLQSTGINDNSREVIISNPSALKVKDDLWLLAYEQTVNNLGGNKNGFNSQNQRDIYLASASDGKNFTKLGRIIDSSQSDNYFASVPNLVLLPDGKIRLYYVTQGNAVGSILSADNGKTWTKEAGLRLGDGAVDPDVLYKDGKWVMYYSQLNHSTNGLYKAVSTDGLTWTALDKQVVTKTGSEYRIVDPDVFEVTPGRYIMFFGESSSAEVTGQEPLNLFSASFNGNPF